MARLPSQSLACEVTLPMYLSSQVASIPHQKLHNKHGLGRLVLMSESWRRKREIGYVGVEGMWARGWMFRNKGEEIVLDGKLKTVGLK